MHVGSRFIKQKHQNLDKTRLTFNQQSHTGAQGGHARNYRFLAMLHSFIPLSHWKVWLQKEKKQFTRRDDYCQLEGLVWSHLISAVEITAIAGWWRIRSWAVQLHSLQWSCWSVMCTRLWSSRSSPGPTRTDLSVICRKTDAMPFLPVLDLWLKYSPAHWSTMATPGSNIFSLNEVQQLSGPRDDSMIHRTCDGQGS